MLQSFISVDGDCTLTARRRQWSCKYVGPLSARSSVNCQLNGLTDVEAGKLDVGEPLPDG